MTRDFHETKVPRLRDKCQDGVRLSALRSDGLYHKNLHLVFIPVRGFVDARDTVRSEGLSQ